MSEMSVSFEIWIVNQSIGTSFNTLRRIRREILKISMPHTNFEIILGLLENALSELGNEKLVFFFYKHAHMAWYLR